MPGHTYREQMSFVEAAIPGCKRLWRWSNTVLQKDTETKGQGTPVEISQSKLQSEVLTVKIGAHDLRRGLHLRSVKKLGVDSQNSDLPFFVKGSCK
ncbi:hypothetical protein TNCV_3325811 [Trichonephila clavipes]|nr:hypothetical protein TNCV_3325811 [Trichonephila clavipes]